MQGRSLLGNRYTLDINAVAIYLVENHPGNKYISKVIDKFIVKGVELILFDFLPLRVYWILTSKWGVNKSDAMESILSFLKLPNVKLYHVDKKDIEEAFNLANKIKHDVFDIVYAIIALKSGSSGIVTTDTDFEKICKFLNLEYINPVPLEALKKFKAFK